MAKNNDAAVYTPTTHVPALQPPAGLTTAGEPIFGLPAPALPLAEAKHTPAGGNARPPRTPLTIRPIGKSPNMDAQAVALPASSAASLQQEAASTVKAGGKTHAAVLRGLASIAGSSDTGMTSQTLKFLKAAGSTAVTNDTSKPAQLNSGVMHSTGLSTCQGAQPSRPAPPGTASHRTRPITVAPHSRSRDPSLPVPCIQPLSDVEKSLFKELIKEGTMTKGERRLYPLEAEEMDQPNFLVKDVQRLQDDEWLNDEIVNSISFNIKVSH